MHFVETMSLFSGLKSKKPHIEESFFPVSFDKYITICTENHSSKQWDHFQEYIDIIIPVLKNNNIGVVELGRNKEKFTNIAILKNATNENQWSYIIKNSLLHVGPENFISSLAAYHGTPCVTLFSNTSPEYASNNWIDNTSEKIIFTPNLKKYKPSFSSVEQKKSINTISAEEVAFKSLNFLNINNSFDKFSVFYIGQMYHQKLLEVVPDFIPNSNFLPRSLINIRLDYCYSPEKLINFANNRKITIVSDQEVDHDILNTIRPNLFNLFFKVDESSNPKYYENLKEKGFNVSLIAKKTANFSDTCFNFFDFKVNTDHSNSKKDLDNFEKICETTRYKSSKTIFSKDGEFSSKSSFDQKIHKHEDQMIIDEDSFWDECLYYKLYNLK